MTSQDHVLKKHPSANIIDYADLSEGKDFYQKLSKSTGGRPSMEYEFNLDAAKEACIVSATPKAKELRRWLIGLSNQRQNLELITVKEAAFAVKVIECLKYVSNQKEALKTHKEKFVSENPNTNYAYAEFNKYRSRIVGWDKEKTDKAINEYLHNTIGASTKIKKSDMNTQLSAIDLSEAIRVSVLDILYSKNEGGELAYKFAEMCKKMAKEMSTQAEKENKPNIWHSQNEITDVKSISLKNKQNGLK